VAAAKPANRGSKKPGAIILIWMMAPESRRLPG